jgi:serine/threonine protein kinase
VSLPTDDGVEQDSALPEDEWATADPDSSAVPPTAEQTRTDEKSYDTTLTQPVAALGADSLLAGLPAGLRDHPRYRVIRELGHGGMGSVYIAEHKLMGRTVALKTVQLRVADNPALVERFLREVRTSAKLSHENVVAAYDAEQTEDTVFLVMEYLQGQDLRQLVVKNGPLDLPAACSLLYQAALGVQHAHERGIIHRDIKPNNLFLVPGNGPITSGRVKVLDFGLAKVLQDAGVYRFETPAGFAMGTMGYMSPEQAADTRSVGIHADIFSLGRTLYYLLSGQLPYRDGIKSLMLEESGRQAVLPLVAIRPDLPVRAAALVERMTARRQQDRFQSCAEVVDALAPMCGR